MSKNSFSLSSGRIEVIMSPFPTWNGRVPLRIRKGKVSIGLAK